jgi:hypothetical protein
VLLHLLGGKKARGKASVAIAQLLSDPALQKAAALVTTARAQSANAQAKAHAEAHAKKAELRTLKSAAQADGKRSAKGVQVQYVVPPLGSASETNPDAEPCAPGNYRSDRDAWY